MVAGEVPGVDINAMDKPSDAKPDQATVWTGSQKSHMTREGVAKLLDLPPDKVRGIWVPGPGSYGRNDAGDGAMDAALLSRAVGKPVRVQGMRHEGHGWDPKGPASGISKVLRGGNWYYKAYYLRTTYRFNEKPEMFKIWQGFRCAKNIDR